MKTIILFLNLIFSVPIFAQAQAQAQAQAVAESKNTQTSSPTAKSKKLKKAKVLNPTPAPTTPAPQKEETILEKAGDTAEKATEATQQAVKDIKESTAETRASRENFNYFGYVTYSPLDLIIPSKIGATIGLNGNADSTWELEYLKGSISVPFLVKDLGKMSDERISIIRRSYLGTNSFNFSYGLSYYDFTLHLGDALLSRMTYGKYPSIDLVEIQSLGFNIGIGNRWTFAKNISFGVDWISWSQPVYTISRKSEFLKYATNQQDRADVDKGLRAIAYFPRLTLLKLQLGVTF